MADAFEIPESPASTDDTDDNNVFEVERILDYELLDKGPFYRVKWLGFPIEQATWEHISNLDGCIELVKEFDRERLRSASHHTTKRPASMLNTVKNESSHQRHQQQSQQQQQQQQQRGKKSRRHEDDREPPAKRKAHTKLTNRRSSVSSESSSSISDTSHLTKSQERLLISAVDRMIDTMMHTQHSVRHYYKTWHQRLQGVTPASRKHISSYMEAAQHLKLTPLLPIINSTLSTDTMDGSPVADIVEIIAKRTEEGGRVYYLARNADNQYSWEQLTSLDNASMLIETFEYIISKKNKSLWQSKEIGSPAPAKLTILVEAASNGTFTSSNSTATTVTATVTDDDGSLSRKPFLKQDTNSSSRIQTSNRKKGESKEQEEHASDSESSLSMLEQPIRSPRRRGLQQRNRIILDENEDDNHSDSSSDPASSSALTASVSSASASASASASHNSISSKVKPVWSNGLNIKRRMLGQRTLTSEQRGSKQSESSRWTCDNLSSTSEEEEGEILTDMRKMVKQQKVEEAGRKNNMEVIVNDDEEEEEEEGEIIVNENLLTNSSMEIDSTREEQVINSVGLESTSTANLDSNLDTSMQDDDILMKINDADDDDDEDHYTTTVAESDTTATTPMKTTTIDVTMSDERDTTTTSNDMATSSIPSTDSTANSTTDSNQTETTTASTSTHQSKHVTETSTTTTITAVTRKKEHCFICGVLFDDGPVNTENTVLSERTSFSYLKPVIECQQCHRRAHKLCFPNTFFPSNVSWKCGECNLYGTLIPERIITWRSINRAGHKSISYNLHYEYAIKFKNKSYRQVQWVTASWLLAVASPLVSSYTLSDRPLTLQQAIPGMWCLVNYVYCIRWIPDTFMTQVLPRLKQHTYIYRIPPLNTNLPVEVIRSILPFIREVFIQWRGLSVAEGTWEAPLDEKDISFSPYYLKAIEHYLYSLWVRLSIPPMKPIDSSTILQVNDDSVANIHAINIFPPNGNATSRLKPFQVESIRWLYQKWCRCQLAWIGDDHGLGRRVQIVGFLSHLVNQHPDTTSLIVTSETLLVYWSNLFTNWAPHIATSIYVEYKEPHAAIKEGLLAIKSVIGRLTAHVAIVAQSALLNNDELLFANGISWSSIIVDDLVSSINISEPLLDPINRLDHRQLIVLAEHNKANTIYQHYLNYLRRINDQSTIQSLPTIQPSVDDCLKILDSHILYRTKKDVIQELPDTIQVILPVTMTTWQRQLYEQLLEQHQKELLMYTNHNNHDNSLQFDSDNARTLFDALRCIIDHDVTTDIDKPSDIRLVSGKYSLLHNLLLVLTSQQHRRVLLLTHSKSVLDQCGLFLTAMSISYLLVHDAMTKDELEKAIRVLRYQKHFLVITTYKMVPRIPYLVDTIIFMDPVPCNDSIIHQYRHVGSKEKFTIFHIIIQQSVEEGLLLALLTKAPSVAEALPQIFQCGMNISTGKYVPPKIDPIYTPSNIEAQLSTLEQLNDAGEPHIAYIWINDKLGTIDLRLALESVELTDDKKLERKKKEKKSMTTMVHDDNESTAANSAAAKIVIDVDSIHETPAATANHHDANTNVHDSFLHKCITSPEDRVKLASFVRRARDLIATRSDTSESLLGSVYNVVKDIFAKYNVDTKWYNRLINEAIRYEQKLASSHSSTSPLSVHPPNETTVTLLREGGSANGTFTSPTMSTPVTPGTAAAIAVSALGPLPPPSSSSSSLSSNGSLDTSSLLLAHSHVNAVKQSDRHPVSSTSSSSPSNYIARERPPLLSFNKPTGQVASTIPVKNWRVPWSRMKNNFPNLSDAPRSAVRAINRPLNSNNNSSSGSSNIRNMTNPSVQSNMAQQGSPVIYEIPHASDSHKSTNQANLSIATITTSSSGGTSMGTSHTSLAEQSPSLPASSLPSMPALSNTMTVPQNHISFQQRVPNDIPTSSVPTATPMATTTNMTTMVTTTPMTTTTAAAAMNNIRAVVLPASPSSATSSPTTPTNVLQPGMGHHIRSKSLGSTQAHSNVAPLTATPTGGGYNPMMGMPSPTTTTITTTTITSNSTSNLHNGLAPIDQRNMIQSKGHLQNLQRSAHPPVTPSSSSASPSSSSTTMTPMHILPNATPIDVHGLITDMETDCLQRIIGPIPLPGCVRSIPMPALYCPIGCPQDVHPPLHCRYRNDLNVIDRRIKQIASLYQLDPQIRQQQMAILFYYRLLALQHEMVKTAQLVYRPKRQ